MLFGLIDRASSAAPLKASLDQSVQRSRSIADRVAQASVKNGDGFSLNGQAAGTAGAANDINIEDEMAALGDEQLRFLATSRLLEKAYQSLRTAIKGEK
jgi:flagellar basal body rod protein FlgB